MNQDDLEMKSISEMTDEELKQHLMEIRSNRRKQPEKPQKKQKKTSGGKKKNDDLGKLLGKMSETEKQKLMEELGNDKNSKS